MDSKWSYIVKYIVPTPLILSVKLYLFGIDTYNVISIIMFAQYTYVMSTCRFGLNSQY